MRRLLISCAALCLLASCEKKESALVLPPAGTASHATLSLGENYDRQIFYDFETGTTVGSSAPADWDLAFEAAPDGRHVFMNGGKPSTGSFAGVFVYNTHQQDFTAVTALPTGLMTSSATGWKFDDPAGFPDSTGVGEWWNAAGNTKGEVYLVETANNSVQKLRILSGNADGYSVSWMPLAGGAVTTVSLPKDTAYNFVYFSFDKGIVKPEPPKTAWDVVFTRYRYIYRHYNPDGSDFPYPVTGVLLNPYRTSAATDSFTVFGDMELQHAASLPLRAARDVIGFAWKSYDINTGQYKANRNITYVLRSRNTQLYKIHFLDFYNSAGQKGNPSFEYERMQ